ncbi:MAG: hypothetical protein ABI333_12190 [bacterium]
MRRLATSLRVLWLAALVVIGCRQGALQEREEEQRITREERLRRARLARARAAHRQRWHERYRRQIAGATTPPPPRARAACDPGRELRQRITSSHFQDQFAQAVQLVAEPHEASLITLDGRPYQRFSFTVRMHPEDAPRLNRARARPELVLQLRFIPLCQTQKYVIQGSSIRIRLARTKGRASTSLWPQGRGQGRQSIPRQQQPTIPVGERIQLLLDPTRNTLDSRPGQPRAGRSGVPAVKTILGVWELADAQFPSRPRSRRLSLQTSALPRFPGLHLLEVPCGGAPGVSCRYLTRQQHRRATPIPFGELLKQAAPLTHHKQIEQLHAILLELKYPSCGMGTRRVDAGTPRHACLGPAAPHRLACQFWKAQHGYTNLAVIGRIGNTFQVSHVLTCPGVKLRVLRLQETYGRNGEFRLVEEDLTPRAAQLDAQLRRR